MRIRMWAAGIVLLAGVAIGFYFIPPIRSFFFGSDPMEVGGHKEADARKKLAFESLTTRLPRGKPISPSRALDADSKKRWEILDRDLAFYQDERATLLKALHEKTRRFFVESRGEGPSRKFETHPDDLLLGEVIANGDLRQPGEPAVFPYSAGEELIRVQPDDEFHFYHRIGLIDFLFPCGFGYVKDRKHVAGFQPHGFRSLSVPDVHDGKTFHKSPWRIHHVQLVGILSHDEPVVYMTDKLPSMEQVRQGSTRSLDHFEKAALPSLFGGDDLYVISKDDTLRMLGALRATQTCQKCHDAQVGDLLGAFSYTLRPAPKIGDGVTDSNKE